MVCALHTWLHVTSVATAAFWGTLLILPHFLFLNFIVEDQKELASPVSPELRQKEVQMNFLNQLTSVFNPRTVPSPPTSPQALVSSFARIASSSCVKMIELGKDCVLCFT